MDFIQRHLEVFKRSEPGRWLGRMSLQSWLKHTNYEQHDTINAAFLGRKLDRSDLIAMRDSSSAMDTRDLCACIFSWGGMKTNHGRALFDSNDQEWVRISSDLRNSSIDHYEAYRQYHSLSLAKRMPGVGPAYYTKLLFFLPPKEIARGIIMDQWTGRSINLLTGKPIVRLVKTETGYRVAPENDAVAYREFCGSVRELALLVNESVENTELRLFSEGGGGEKSNPWRAYVIEHKAETPERR